MARLPESGSVSYNGVDLISVSEQLTTSVTAKPILDAAGRTTADIEYTITCEGVIQSDSGTNTTLETLRRALLVNGGALVYSGRGFGTDSLSVNVAGGTIKDVAWGPKPQMLSWKPVGAENACRFTWQVTTRIPECSGGTSATRYSNAFAEVAYRWQVAIDRSGLSRRTVSGMARIATTKSSATATRIQDVADSYREKLVPPLLPGFYRDSQAYDVDEAKSTITFSVTDIERPSANVYPPGIIDAEISHEVNSDRRQGFTSWQATIAGRYEMVKGSDPTLAWNHFFYGVYKTRRNWTKRYTSNIPGAVLPMSLSVRESNAYGKNIAEFSIAYTYITSWRNFLLASGLWLPIAGSNDALWRSSLSNSALHPRGLAKLRLSASDDVIINLCSQPSLPLGRLQNNSTQKYGRFFAQEETVDPAHSWLSYDVRVAIEVDDPAPEYKPLTSNQVELRAGGIVADLATPGGLRGGRIGNNQLIGGTLQNNGIPPGYTPGTLATTQATIPSIYVWLTGGAVRAGFAITPPQLERCGGVEVIPSPMPGCGAVSWICFNAGGVPINKCIWKYRYLFTQAPTQPILPPANPMLM